MHCPRVSELAGGYVVNDLLCMLEQPYLRRNFVDDIVRLLLDIVKDTKSQVRHCPPTPGHCQGYQEPGRYDIVRLLLDIVKDSTESQVRHCPPSLWHCPGYQAPGTTLSVYAWTLSRIPRVRYYTVHSVRQSFFLFRNFFVYIFGGDANRTRGCMINSLARHRWTAQCATPLIQSRARSYRYCLSDLVNALSCCTAAPSSNHARYPMDMEVSLHYATAIPVMQGTGTWCECTYLFKKEGERIKKRRKAPLSLIITLFTSVV